MPSPERVAPIQSTPHDPKKHADWTRAILLGVVISLTATLLAWYLGQLTHLRELYVSAPNSEQLKRSEELLRQHRELGVTASAPLMGVILAIIAYFYPKQSS